MIQIYIVFTHHKIVLCFFLPWGLSLSLCTNYIMFVSLIKTSNDYVVNLASPIRSDRASAVRASAPPHFPDLALMETLARLP